MVSLRHWTMGLLLACAAGSAAAQTVGGGAEGRRYGPAPWWMREPIIASSGQVELRMPANQAGFSATFQSVERDLGAATRATAGKVRQLGQALAAYGADKVQVQITFSTRPLYEQYRDRQGQVQENQRSDQIDRYEVNAQVTIVVRDLAVLERVYATVLAAGPASTNPVYFSMDPTNETRRDLAQRAVEDATRRARQAAEAAGTRLGAVRLIDPSGRACETDVLVAGAPRDGEADEYDDVTVTASRAPPAPPPPPPPPPAPGAGSPEQFQVPLQPPLMSLRDSACVVFALGG